TMNPSALVDLSECTLLPGLIDAHMHLFISGTADEEKRKKQLNEGFNQTRKTISRHLGQLFAHGILAVRDGGDRNGYTQHYKKYFMEEQYAAICLHVAGKAWHNAGRYGSFVGRSLGRGRLAEGILRESNDIDHVKIIQSGVNSLKYFGKESLPQFQLKALRDAVDAASSLGLKTMVHANGKVPVQIALEAGCSSIEHGFFMGEQNLNFMADRQVFWVPTAGTMKAFAEHARGSDEARRMALRNLEHQLEQMALARRLGVPIALGTDSGSVGVHHGSALIEELQLLLDTGFSIEEAIKCASFNNASLLGLDRKGLIKKGMQADFVVVKGSPSALPESLKAVFRIHVGKRFL
ncbi:MAG: amidohydrolase family protein, partial [Deltaproteobacteria bacterium]|nr:amidohydrolase family protein [Deltaproteobacteria bacterium]